MTSRTGRALLGALAIVSIGGASVPALAQDSTAESRLRKLEAEVRALQRTVFPGPNGRYFQPEITGPAPVKDEAQGRPSTTALTDVLARLDALEAQIQSLTARTERNTNTLSEIETRLAALEVTSTAPAAAIWGSPAENGSRPLRSTGRSSAGTSPNRPR